MLCSEWSFVSGFSLNLHDETLLQVRDSGGSHAGFENGSKRRVNRARTREVFTVMLHFTFLVHVSASFSKI